MLGQFGVSEINAGNTAINNGTGGDHSPQVPDFKGKRALAST